MPGEKMKSLEGWERLDSSNLDNSLNIGNVQKRKELRDLFGVKGKEIYIIKCPDFVSLPGSN